MERDFVIEWGQNLYQVAFELFQSTYLHTLGVVHIAKFQDLTNSAIPFPGNVCYCFVIGKK